MKGSKETGGIEKEEEVMMESGPQTHRTKPSQEKPEAQEARLGNTKTSVNRRAAGWELWWRRWHQTRLRMTGSVRTSMQKRKEGKEKGRQQSQGRGQGGFRTKALV